MVKCSTGASVGALQDHELIERTSRHQANAHSGLRNTIVPRERRVRPIILKRRKYIHIDSFSSSQWCGAEIAL
jgi:hypothetical protein